jgi:hypothetical protein
MDYFQLLNFFFQMEVIVPAALFFLPNFRLFLPNFRSGKASLRKKTRTAARVFSLKEKQTKGMCVVPPSSAFLS